MSGAQITSLGKYAIRGMLGKGAMGIVYDGWDPVIDRRVAIKTVRLPDAHDEEAAEGLARFKREAQAAGRLTHPNIVGVFDYGETDDLAFIVMEFVEGRSLKDVLGANERMTTAHTLALMDDILAGLTFSHARGVVHRDIKPANIMITLDDRAKIADFGIARIEASSMTQAGTVLGTPAYMSPEQFMGQVVDRRTDIYSCGVLLYQLLTGDRPFEGSMTAIMHKVLTTVPPRPSELAVTAPANLDGVVAKAMARRPEDRYADAAAFARALHAPPAEEAFASDATVVAVPRPAAPPPPAAQAAAAQQVRETSGSKLPVFVGGGAAVLAAAAAALWFGLPSHEPAVSPVQPPPAPGAQQARTGPGLAAPSPLVQVPPVQSPPAAEQQPAAQTPPPQQASNSTGSSRLLVSPLPSSGPELTSPAPLVSAPATAPSTSPFLVVPPPSSAQPPAPTATPPAPVPSSPAPNQQASLTVPPPVTAPSVPAPVRSQAAIEAALAGSLPAVKCSLARATVAPDGTVTVTGVAGDGPSADALHRAIAASEPAAANWQVQSFNGPYCPALDTLRPLADAIGQDRGGMEMAQVGGPASLQDNQVIALKLTMPGFAGFLHVEYLQHDATVAPQVPGPGYPSQTYAARAQLELGTPRQDFEGWHVGPPFGTDMIIAVASTAPLFSRPLPDTQSLPAYLSSLQTAIEALRRRGGSVAATALVLDTRPAR